jgi:hypothetical protein
MFLLRERMGLYVSGEIYIFNCNYIFYLSCQGLFVICESIFLSHKSIHINMNNNKKTNKQLKEENILLKQHLAQLQNENAALIQQLQNDPSRDQCLQQIQHIILCKLKRYVQVPELANIQQQQNGWGDAKDAYNAWKYGILFHRYCRHFWKDISLQHNTPEQDQFFCDEKMNE